MPKKREKAPVMTQRQALWGWCYWILQLLILPRLLVLLNNRLPTPLSDSWLNLSLYCLNFSILAAIFHGYLIRCLAHVGRNFGRFLKASLLGFCVYWLCSWGMSWLLEWLAPEFANPGDSNLTAMLRQNFWPLATAMVALVPVAEELCFRGLVFQGLYGKNRAAAYLLSCTVFAAVHVTGYLGTVSFPTLIISFVQYIPAGLCLAWACAEADNIFAPIVIHSVINFLGIYRVR